MERLHALSSEISLTFLLSLADSSLPVGGLAHSGGLEQYCQTPGLCPEKLESYLEFWLSESFVVEGSFCTAGFRLTSLTKPEIPEGLFSLHDKWKFLNDKFEALRVGRESRQASEKMGYRLIDLCRVILPVISTSFHLRPQGGSYEDPKIYLPPSGHYPLVFGYLGYLMGLEEFAVLVGFLNQAVQAQISAAQRLLPLGQIQATRIAWSLKLTITELARKIMASPRVTSPSSFAPMLDLATMNHPYLSMRLFLS